MAGLPPDPVITGAVIIFHDTANNTILLGEEGKDLFDDTDKASNYYRYHPVLTQSLVETHRIGPIVKNFTREELTAHILPLIMQHITQFPPSKAYTLGTNLLFPIVELSRDKQIPPIPNVSTYFSRPRIQVGLKESCPKGGIKSGESAIQCIQREVYEEIGDIFGSVPITEKDWIRDRSGQRYVTDIIHKGHTEPYAVFYKQVNPAQIQTILMSISNRRAQYIGEVFDFVFKRTPPFVAGIRSSGLNLQSESAITKVNDYLRSSGQKQLGGAKKTRRSYRKRRTSSKRR